MAGKYTNVDHLMINRSINLVTYKAILALQTSLPVQLERCWTQEPTTLEDALGKVTPIRLEFLDSWEVSRKIL